MTTGRVCCDAQDAAEKAAVDDDDVIDVT